MLTRKNKSSSRIDSEVREEKRSKMIDKEVCKACNDEFDSSSQRPRVLPCGHTCCSHCINTSIKDGSLNCPGCKKVHNVKLAEDLPPNIYLEEIIAKALEQKHEVVEEDEDKENTPKHISKSKSNKNLSKKDSMKFNAGTCPEHSSCLLDHRCISHKCWVCSECIEEEHPQDSCQVITFKCEIENRMKQQECLLDTEFTNCKDAIKQLHTYISRVEAEEKRQEETLSSLEEMISTQREMKNSLTKERKEGMLLLENGEKKQNSLKNGKKVLEGILTLQDANSIRQDVKTWMSASKNWISVSQEKFEGSSTIYSAMKCRMRTKMLLDLEKFCRDEIDIKESVVKKEETESPNGDRMSSDDIVPEEESLDQIEEKELFANMKMKIIAKVMLQHVQATHNVKMDFNGSVDWDKLARSNVMDRMYLVLLNEALTHPETIKAGAYAVVESSKVTKSAHLSVQEGRIHLHGLENTEPPENSYTIPMLPLQNFIDPDHPSVFMDLCAGGRWLGRVYIRLIGRSRHAQQFLALCLGVHGASYRGARFAEVGFRGMPGECVVCEEYVTENGICNKGILDGLVNEGEDIRRQGMVFKSTWDGGDFLICTRDLRNQSFRCPIGEVVSGLNVIREAVRGHGPIREVIITAVGAVVEGNFSGEPPIHFVPRANVEDIPSPTDNSGNQGDSQGNQSMDLGSQDMDLGNRSYEFGSQSDERSIKTEDSEEYLKSVLKIKNEKNN